VFILKIHKVIFFTLLQVLILKDLYCTKIVQKLPFLPVPQFVKFSSEGAVACPKTKKLQPEAAAN